MKWFPLVALGLVVTVCTSAFAQARYCVSVYEESTGDYEYSCTSVEDDTSWSNWGPNEIHIWTELTTPSSNEGSEASGYINYDQAYPETHMKGRYSINNLGDSCTTVEGTNGIVSSWKVGVYGTNPNVIEFYVCREDWDGDGIINVKDDCPFDPHDEGGCMDDLMDCDEIIERAVYATVGASRIGGYIVKGAYKKAGKTIPMTVARVIGASNVVGAVVLTGTATYCAIAEWENGDSE